MSPRKFLDRIIDNWPAKVLSIAIAIVLFMFHRMSALEERFFSVPLNIESNETLVPASSYPRMVRVTLKGEANVINPIIENDIEPYLDLTRYTEKGVYNVPVLIRRKGTAAGVDPLEVQVEPLEIAISVEEKLTRTVPVTPSFRGFLESGYELASYEIEPSLVDVSGPASLVLSVDDVMTDFIELTGRKEDFSVFVNLLNRDSLLTIQGQGMVEFRAFVQQSVSIRNYERLPIVISGLQEGFIARPKVNFGSIRLQGNVNDLDTYEPEASILSLDCSDIQEEGVYLLPLLVSAPPGFTVLRYDPVEITVEVVADEKSEEASVDAELQPEVQQEKAL